ncbi:MAG: HAMP domain-containing histidine kinase [Defluviitaleaceae bacterium]|nr:HAMP domain-containing histidine kinase [Defluviitaleaceae bacterium]MCL2836365.1 HAMP domain-containing histidine kinase [Defluviitaleaceae bacterium]
MSKDDFTLSLNEMAATLAHEVRNPLALALVNLNLLELNSADEDRGRYEIIKRELGKVNELMTGLAELAIAPETAGRTELRALLEDITAPFAATYGGDIAFHVKAGQKITIQAPPCRLRLIFNNIIKNAVEAIKSRDGPPKGRGKVQITLTEERGRALVVISDNGKGIDKAEAAKAFEPRFTTKENGSGIGLFAAGALAVQLGGGIHITGKPGEGCTVEISFPL